MVCFIFNSEMFNIKKYGKNIKNEIYKIFEHKYNDDFINDILLDNFFSKNKLFVEKSKKIKQIQMKIGLIWQIAIGNYDNFINLKIGDKTGLDILSNERKIIIELKNRYNTDNSSSKKTNYKKLMIYKKEHPDYDCIYGVINEKNQIGIDKKIKINDYEIRYLSGDKLLTFIFDKNKENIINIIKNIINIHLNI